MGHGFVAPRVGLPSVGGAQLAAPVFASPPNPTDRLSGVGVENEI